MTKTLFKYHVAPRRDPEHSYALSVIWITHPEGQIPSNNEALRRLNTARDRAGLNDEFIVRGISPVDTI
jgi:hypothetical protein